MATKNDTTPKEKKKGFLERNGFVTSNENKEAAEKQPTSFDIASDKGPETGFVFDFTEAAKASEAPVASEPVVIKKVQNVSSTNVADPKIAEKLKKVLTDSNFPGPDYFEFKQQLDALSDIIPDELTRYKAAYKSLVVQGVTKSKITDSAGKYVEILTAENSKFSEAISQKNSTDIDLKTQEAKVLNTESVNMQKQIDALNARILENTQKIKGLGAEVQKAQTEIADAKKRFENTLNIFVTEIQANADKVKSYIQ